MAGAHAHLDYPDFAADLDEVIRRANEAGVRRILTIGTGIVTFKNAQLVREVVAEVPDGAFMVETDCPYLAPVPHRGKRCEPVHTRLVAEKIAEIRGTSLEHIATATEKTAAGFFRMSGA